LQIRFLWFHVFTRTNQERLESVIRVCCISRTRKKKRIC
jgi:3-deoxy-D-arabinoheptulosonate-7-phosphate synthase (EC 2.5.1.54)